MSKGEIVKQAHLGKEDQDEFRKRMIEIIDSFQSDGLEVEIHYASHMNLHTAYILGRKQQKRFRFW